MFGFHVYLPHHVVIVRYEYSQNTTLILGTLSRTFPTEPPNICSQTCKSGPFLRAIHTHQLQYLLPFCVLQLLVHRDEIHRAPSYAEDTSPIHSNLVFAHGNKAGACTGTTSDAEMAEVTVVARVFRVAARHCVGE